MLQHILDVTENNREKELQSIKSIQVEENKKKICRKLNSTLGTLSHYQPLPTKRKKITLKINFKIAPVITLVSKRLRKLPSGQDGLYTSMGFSKKEKKNFFENF